MFPAFCIVLPETPERTEQARKHFKEVGINVQFFEGIHAEKFGLNTEHKYELDSPGSGYRIGYKPTGIWLSHWALWSALNMRPEKYFLVLECDAKFQPDWQKRLEQALRCTPDNMDFLYIGSCCCKDKPMKRVMGDVWEVHYPLCTHAYVIAKKALPTVLKTQRKVYAPIDVSLELHTLPFTRCYTVLPRIVDQFDTVIGE